MNTYRAKRWISKVLSITMILILTACQSKPDPQTLGTILNELDVSFNHANDIIMVDLPLSHKAFYSSQASFKNKARDSSFLWGYSVFGLRRRDSRPIIFSG